MSIGNANIHQVSEIPEITKLPNGRLRVVRRFNKFTREDVDNANYGSLMGDFGDLDTAGQQIVNQGYTNLQLISVEVDNRFNAVTNNSNAVLVKTYETLTDSFVQVTDEDQIEELENGIKRLTRVLRAQSGTTYSGDVGVTTTTVNLLDYTLSKSDLKDSGAFAELTLTFLSSGITDVREDIVGSQKAIVITKVGSEPTTLDASSKSDITYDGSSDWSIARKDVSQEGGLEVYTYTFLLDNTILSQSQDKQSSLKTEVIEVFNPKVTIPGISVEGGSNIAGDYFKISTQFGGKNYYQQKTGSFYEKSISYNSYTSTWTFSLHSTTYSSSTDVNPDNSDDPPTTGWSGQGDSELFNMTFRDFDQTLPQSTNGLDTSHRYEKEGYSLINVQRSNLDGIPTMRYTFAKDNSVLSVSEDKVGAQNAIVNEIFNPTSETITGVDSDNVALSGYSEVDRTESNYEGIKTIRVRFLKNDSILSVSEDFVGSQRAIVNEVFNPHQDGVSGKDTSNQALSGYSEADRTESNYNGIKTIRVRFLKNGVLLSQTSDFLGSQKGIVNEVFNPTNGTEPPPLGGYILVNKQQSDFSGIPTIRFSYLKQNTVLSVSEDKVGSQLAVVNEIFDPTGTITGQDASGTALSGYSEADRSISQVDGIETVRVRFLKNDTVLSRSRDSVGSQKAVVLEVFNGDNQVSDANSYGAGTNYVLAREEESNVDGVKTRRYTYLEPSIISVSQDFVEDINTIQVTAFSKTESEVKTALTEVTNNHKLINQRENNHDGIVTTTYTFEINTSDVVRYTANNRLQVVRTIYESDSYNYNANYDVGTTSITFSDAGSTTLVLSELQVNKRGTTGTFVKLEAIFTEPGESARSETTGPTSMPGTERVTITSSGSTPIELTETDDIKLVSKQQQNNNGFSTFVRSYLKGTDATSTTNTYISGRTYKINSNGDYSSVGGPSTGVIGDYFQATSGDELGSEVTAYLVGQITGTKVTYENILQVQVPGTVKCVTHDAIGLLNESDVIQGGFRSQSALEVIPPNRIKIKATVTESIETTIPAVGTLAYNLDNISCSVSKVSTNYKEHFGSVAYSRDGDASRTAFASNASLSASNSYFPGSYILDNDNSAIAVTDAVKGRQYRIVAINDGQGGANTDFTLIGSSSNDVNTVFVATGAGTGTGTVKDFGIQGRLKYLSSEGNNVGDISVNGMPAYAEVVTNLITNGSTSQSDGSSAPSSYSTTGTIQQKARPVLTTIDGTTYYEVVKFSKS